MKTAVVKRDGGFTVRFHHKNQYFRLDYNVDTFKQAAWMKKMLDIAFRKALDDAYNQALEDAIGTCCVQVDMSDRMFTSKESLMKLKK